MLTALVACGVLAGLAGAWSPCGLSMVDTLAPDGHAGRIRTSVAASAAFAAGALAGGVVTFGGLALAGAALGLGGGTAVSLAAAALLVGALGDGAGRRIVPQLRRQVPESWRRLLPVPLAAAGYGVLLGLGFTTFVLSFATYALALACLALADAGVGAAVGLAFAAGRAIPVLGLAPLQGGDRPARIAAGMAERPQVLRALRGAAAAASLAAVVAMGAGGAPAAAAELFSRDSADPRASATAIAWQAGDGRGLMLRGGSVVSLPGREPAAAADTVAWHADGQLVVARQDDLRTILSLPAPAAEEPAVSARFLAWRESAGAGRDRLLAFDFAAGGPPRVLARSSRPGVRLGRPSLDETRLVFHIAGPRAASRLVEIDLVSGARTTLRRARRTLLLNPTASGDRLVYVRSSARAQELVMGDRLAPETDRRLYAIAPTARRDAGREPGRHRHRAGYPDRRPPKLAPRPAPGVTRTLWTTALDASAAYVTRLSATRGAATGVILRVPLPPASSSRTARSSDAPSATTSAPLSSSRR